jgi:hypothetical protein
MARPQGGLQRDKGRPTFPQAFNILVNAVANKWHWELQEDGDHDKEELANLAATFFTIF